MTTFAELPVLESPDPEDFFLVQQAGNPVKQRRADLFPEASSDLGQAPRSHRGLFRRGDSSAATQGLETNNATYNAAGENGWLIYLPLRPGNSGGTVALDIAIAGNTLEAVEGSVYIRFPQNADDTDQTPVITAGDAIIDTLLGNFDATIEAADGGINVRLQGKSVNWQSSILTLDIRTDHIPLTNQFGSVFSTKEEASDLPGAGFDVPKREPLAAGSEREYFALSEPTDVFNTGTNSSSKDHIIDVTAGDVIVVDANYQAEFPPGSARQVGSFRTAFSFSAQNGAAFTTRFTSGPGQLIPPLVHIVNIGANNDFGVDVAHSEMLQISQSGSIKIACNTRAQNGDGSSALYRLTDSVMSAKKIN